MKRPVSVFLAVAILVSMLVNYSIYVQAAGGNAIAIMIEQNSFDNSNVGGDGESTLLWMKGNSTLNGGQLLLTNNSWQAGSVVKRNQVKLTDGFSTYFQINFSANADGIAFVLYKSDAPKLGENGGALGYGDKGFEYYGSDAGIKDGIDNSIHDSIVVEFDTWKNYGDNSDQYDLNNAGYNNHAAIMLDGNQAHVRQSDSGAAVYTNASLSGQTINAWVDYNSGNGTDTTGTVTVTFGTGATKDDAANHTISRTIQVSDNTPIEGDNVFVGFTSSTGGNATTHKLLKWYFKDSYAAGGLNPTAGTYTQAPATLSVVPDNAGTNPANAAITIKDNSGAAMPNEAFSVYLDGSSTPVGTYDTGLGAVYSFTIPSDLSNGSHTIRAVGEGGVTNFAAFTVDKHTVTYNGNGNTGGTVPSASIHNDGTTVTVSANSGSLVKTGYDFAGWNTQADGSGTAYHSGSGQILNISDDITLYAIWSKFSASEGSSSFVTSGAAIVIDSGIAIEGFTESISGARVMIQNKKTGDMLSYTNAGGISGTYDSTAGVLTLEGSATSAQYQTALRSVRFSTTSNDTTDRTILFSLGGGLYYSDNGHFYEYVDSLNISWSDAKTAAEGRSLYGRQGYLATLTSAEENAFVTDKVTALGWIGAKDIHYVDINSDDKLGDWRWVTGPEGLANGGNGTGFYSGYSGASGTTVTYSNWWQGEPNNAGNVEYVAHIFGPADTMPAWALGSSNPASPGEWNDFEPGRNDGAVKGYVVEYGGIPGDTPIVVQAARTITVNTLSNDATLKSTIKIKGVTVTDLGTPSATIEGVTAGSVTLTAVQGADTSNAGSYMTSFVANNIAGTVNKIVKYASGTATTNFDTTDTAYNGTDAIVNGDFFVVKVTAEDSTVNYYKITVTVNSPLSSDAGLTSVLGQVITAGAEDGTSGMPKTASISVTNDVSTVAAADIVKHNAGATVTFYGTDSTFMTPAAGSVNLTAGSGTDVYIKVTAADSTILYYKVTINRASYSSDESDSSTPATPTQPADTGVEILVNGKSERAATATTTQEGDQTVTIVAVDDKKVEEKLQAEGNYATVTIPVKNDAD
ncbi:MAG: InlB B-repeat-containing protein, partial [Clostridiaceae bacterium]